MKKGSMQLGINAIVILIIALAILGLAMAFITKLFGQGEDTFTGIITRDHLPIHADATNPIKLSTGELEVKTKSDDNKIIASVYNSKFGGAPVNLTIDCQNPGGGGSSTGVTLVSGSQAIPVGSDAGFAGIISLDESVVEGTYPCRIYALGPGDASVSATMFLKVVS